MSVGIGIGANTAIFSLVNAVMMRKAPLDRPGELVDLYKTLPGFTHGPLSFPDLRDLQDETTDVFAGVAGFRLALAQTDLKRLVAYSSVSHMGYVLLGIAALGHVSLNGAALQMFTHGTITGLLFVMVGVIYDRAHTRDIDQLSGLAHTMPLAATVMIIAGLASLGLPAMSGFVAEFDHVTLTGVRR